MGVAVADYDNDGNLDLFVTGFGGSALYHGLGNCKFEDVTEKAGVAGSGFMTGAAWGDYDRDGFVDLYVSRYSHLDMNNLPQFGSNKFCRFKGILVQCGPWGLEGESDFLYHNRGDGTFEEVSLKAGVHNDIGYYGLGVMWVDYDDDGWPDLLVANDSVPNYLYHNNHNGTFTDIGMLTGVALSGEGMELGNMGVDWGRLHDHTGRLSFFVTHFEEQPNSLYRNMGTKGFDDVSWTSGVGQPSYAYVGWGTAFFDMDNDTWLDILVANGHVYPQIDTLETGPRYREPLLLHRPTIVSGTFDEVSKESGLAALPLHSRRGAAFGDVFNTGNVDVLLLNVGEPPSLLKNMNADGYHRVLFKLIGTKSNRAAIGARVTIRAAGQNNFRRSPRRGELSLAERPSPSLRPRRRQKNGIRRNSLARTAPSRRCRMLRQTAFTRSWKGPESETPRPCRRRPQPPAAIDSRGDFLLALARDALRTHRDTMARAGHQFPGFVLPLSGRHRGMVLVLVLTVSFVPVIRATDNPGEALRRQFEAATRHRSAAAISTRRKATIVRPLRWVCGSWVIFPSRKSSSNRPRASWMRR